MALPRILFINDACAYGGAEFYQMILAEECQRKGWSSTMVLLNEPALNDWCGRLTGKGIKVIRYCPDEIVSRSLRQKITSCAPDLVHANASNHAGFFRTLQEARIGRASVLSEHAFPFSVPLTLSWWSALRTRLQGKHWREKQAQWLFADRIITVNGVFRSIMIHNWGVVPNKVVSIYNGVDSEEFEGRGLARRNLLAILGREPDSPIILTTGRMAWMKGGDLLLKAMAKLKKEAWYLVVVGDGDFLPNLRQLAYDLNITDHVHFIGHRSDLNTFLAGADIFVLPTRNEAIGFSLLEAMVCGVASIGTAVGGVPEVLGDSEYGLLVPSENVRALSGAIHRLLTDRHLRQTLGSKGRDRIVSNFTQKQMIEKTLRVYEELL